MNVKQIILTLVVFFAMNAVATGQVKKQYQDDVHKSTTVVVKEDGASDLDILHSQFNLDDFKVNEQIKITTEQSLPPASGLSDNVSGGKLMSAPAPDLSNATASTTTTYERPKSKMKRWSVRDKKDAKVDQKLRADEVDLNTRDAKIIPVTSNASPVSNVNTKKASSGKYRKKSKKAGKKKRVRKFKHRKRKAQRNRRGACYKF